MRSVKYFFLTAILTAGITPALAQDIYIYPNKKLADQGLIEYRRYTLEEAAAYEQGGSFDPYLTLDWGLERRLTEQENVYRARVVTSGDSLFCAYSLIAGRQVYFIRSLDSGMNWEPYQTLVDTAQDFSYAFPEIVCDGSNLMIGTGMQDAPYGKNFGYFRSTNNGETWGELSKIFPYESNNRLHYSSFTNRGERVYASYVSVHDHDSIYVVISTNWGDTWNGRGINVAYLSSTPQPMTVRASGSDVHLVWVNEEGTISPRYSRSTDLGQTWSHEIDIANDEDGAQFPFIAVQDTHVVASWMGYMYSPCSFTGDLFIRQSFDSGNSWDSAQVLTDLHKVMSGSIYIEDSLIVALWMDARYEDGNDEVMVRYSEDYGESWTVEERLSYGDYHSHAPISCGTGEEIHVLWGDLRPSAPGLYYCANDMTTAIADENIDLLPNISYISCYPNPFNSSTVITYSDLEGGDIRIYDITGRLIRTLRTVASGGRVTWDAADIAGRKVSSGIYFARGKTLRNSRILKLIYLK